MSVMVSDQVHDLEVRLRALGSPERAIQERAYLKSDYEFVGVSTPIMRNTFKVWLRELGPLDRIQVLELADELWDSNIFERRRCSVELLDLRVPLLGVDDLAACESRVRDSHTWALVDHIATRVAGEIVLRCADIERVDVTLDAWALDEDFWVRRSALLSQLPILRRPTGDTERFLRYCDTMLCEKEFFIRKAIGWGLRDISRKRPEIVFDWLLPRAATASTVTFREAVKYLPDDDCERLNTARAL